jgi:hypothetical protein
MGRRRYCRYLVRPPSIPAIVLIVSDNHQRMCLTLGLWNGKDRMLKERMFGLNGGEGTSLLAVQFGADMQEITEKMSRKCTGTSTLLPLTPT